MGYLNLSIRGQFQFKEQDGKGCLGEFSCGLSQEYVNRVRNLTSRWMKSICVAILKLRDFVSSGWRLYWWLWPPDTAVEYSVVAIYLLYQLATQCVLSLSEKILAG